MITNHTQLLNWLIDKYKFKSYLEIGVQSVKQNFDKVKAPFKLGVDPEVTAKGVLRLSSDEFFCYVKGFQPIQGEAVKTYDLIFIDGLHHADQVQRDFENSLKCLNEGGRIVIHDTLPEHEETTHVPRDSKQWHGDVYKFAMELQNRDGIDFHTVNMDNGCTVVWKDENCASDNNFAFTNFGWELYMKYRQESMRIIQPSDIETYL